MSNKDVVPRDRAYWLSRSIDVVSLKKKTMQTLIALEEKVNKLQKELEEHKQPRQRGRPRKKYRDE